LPQTLIPPGSAPPLFFVMNGGSGRHDAEDTRRDIEAAMQAADRPHRIFVIEDASQIQVAAQQAVDAAKEQGGVVVAVGGDGTINAVANTVLRNGCLFGAIPQGTFNYFGRTHGIPEEIGDALDDLLQGEPVPVQVGLVNDHVFLVNASVGLYPELLEDREAFKQQYGRSRLVAIWAAIATVFSRHRTLNMMLEQEGERVTMRTTTLFVGNNRLQLEQVGMPQAEAVVQGQLAAIAVRPIGKLAMLWLGACGALGRLGDAENVIGFSFRKLTIAPRGKYRVANDTSTTDAKSVGKKSRRNKIKVAADGEIMWLRPPLEFRVASEPLLLIKRRHALGAENEKRGAEVSVSAGVDDNADWKTKLEGDAA
jgi:diacylglycerol kinase family enzyme